MMQRAIQFLQREPAIWGPISLLCTVAIGIKTAIPFDLLFLSASGLILCARWHMRGWSYSLLLLTLVAIIKHSFLVSDHLWQLGVEGSLACAFLIIALASEQGAAWIESLQSQMETRDATVQNLEEELVKTREMTQEQQIAFQEKISLLQKELEEIQSDHSSILILNEVLRKTSARATQENEALHASLLDVRRQKEILKAEFEECRHDIERLSNADSMARQNAELLKELNSARYEREQTHLINETLARLYARESLKAKDSDQEAASLADQLTATRKEVGRLIALSDQFTTSQKDLERLSNELAEKNAVLQEQGALTEQLHAARKIAENTALALEIQVRKRAELEKELQELMNRPKVDPEVVENLAFAQKKMMHLSQIEPLFKQLKKQFDEKTNILHQTRVDLFRTDTELQQLKIERSALDLQPVPKEVENELKILTEEILILEEENRELQEIVTLLTENPQDAAKRKKKLKTLSNLDQEFLF